LVGLALLSVDFAPPPPSLEKVLQILLRWILPHVGLSIVRPVRPGGHPGRDGVNREERSEDHSLAGSRDQGGYPTGPGMDVDSVAEWLSG